MPLVACKCPSCGADLEFDESRDFMFCSFCGTKVIKEQIQVNQTINQTTVVNAQNVNLNAKSADWYYTNLRGLLLQDNFNEQVFNDVLKKAQLEYPLDTRFNVLDEISKMCRWDVFLDRPLCFSGTDYEFVKVLSTGYYDNYYGKYLWKAKGTIFGVVLTCYNSECGSSYYYLSGQNKLLAKINSISDNEIKSKVLRYFYTKTIPVTDLESAKAYVLKNKAKYEAEVGYSTNLSVEGGGNNESWIVALRKPAPPQSSSGGCYVATAVYGSYDCPQVWALRRYRDFFLADRWYGRAFIKVYYAISPTLVRWFGDKKWFSEPWKAFLDKKVDKLLNNGYEATPYEDKEWK